MAIIGKLSDMCAMFAAKDLQGIYAYLLAASREGSCEFDRILATTGEHKVDLDSGAFAIEQSYCLKHSSQAFYETHKRYVDVQLVIKGEEIFSIAMASDCMIKDPYNAEKDLITYHPPKHTSWLHLSAGMLAVFFPYDVHSGGLGAESMGAKSVYKSVVKVPIDLLDPRL